MSVQLNIESKRLVTLPNPTEERICSLTQYPFKDPVFLVEDQTTYERKAIEAWLSTNPFLSPKGIKIPGATLIANRAVIEKDPVCPITHEKFQCPVLCAQDGYTYEYKAIRDWIDSTLEAQANSLLFDSPHIKGPMTGEDWLSITLYPNKILFPDEKITNDHDASEYKIDINALFEQKRKKITYSCIRDKEIRDWLINRDPENDSELAKKILDKRSALKLPIYNGCAGIFPHLELSNFDLSSMKLKDLKQKGAVTVASNFSGNLFIDCDFGRNRFKNCNMQNCCFSNCSFPGEEVSFSGTDFTNASFDSRCFIEKGTTWNHIYASDSENFRKELAVRGAKGVETIRFLEGN